MLEAVHLLFSFKMFVVLIAVDTRWQEQSLRIHYRQLLDGSAAPSPTDYLEKIIQIPLHLLQLNESMVRTMIAGLTQAVPELKPAAEQAETVGSKPDGAGTADPSGASGASVTATIPRASKPLPAEVMHVTAATSRAGSGSAGMRGGRCACWRSCCPTGCGFCAPPTPRL